MGRYLVLSLALLIGCKADPEKKIMRGRGIFSKPATPIAEEKTPVIVSFKGANEANDGVLSVVEIHSKLPIATLVAKEAQEVSFSAILDDGNDLTCDDKQVYDLTSVPAIKTTPTVDGVYAVCVKAKHGSKVIYGKSQSIRRSAVVTLSLVNEASDGTVTPEEISSHLDMVTSLEIGGASIFYRLYSHDVDCAAVDFSTSNIPRISELIGKNGSYKVCAKIVGFDRTYITVESDPITVVEDYWKSITTSGDAPVAREKHSAVWTGTKMIIWGGVGATNAALKTGSMYDPVTNSWTKTLDAPTERQLHEAVWTGSEMIVWGGSNAASTLEDTALHYDPVADAWTVSPSAPFARTHHTVVWSGSRVIVWGGNDAGGVAQDDGAAYDPIAKTWSSIPAAANSPEARSQHAAVWTGSKMIIWGGIDALANRINTGSAYDPASDNWVAVSTVSAPTPRVGMSVLWTGTKMLIWGGDDSAVTNTGAFYDPVADDWVAITTENAPSGRAFAAAVKGGSKVYIWGGALSGNSPTDTGGMYDLNTNKWLLIDTSDIDHPSSRKRATAVWSGSKLIVWGGASGTVTNSGAVFTPSSMTPVDYWRAGTSAGAPVGRTSFSAVWMNDKKCGVDSTGTMLNDGAKYDAVTNSWTPIANTHGLTARYRHSGVGVGAKMLIWGGCGMGVTRFNDGAIYDPVSDSWQAMTTTSAPSARCYHSTVSTGEKMIVWGGDDGGVVNTGAIYDARNNTWVPTNASSAPLARITHKSVWTGSKMIVWGGSPDGSAYLNSGAIFDPALDSWTPMSTTAAPSPRASFSLNWTGSKMAVWGGVTGLNTYSNDGALYDPTADAWSAIASLNAPLARSEHTAVWTGKKMVVWGGIGDGIFASGAIYDPTHDTWVPVDSSDPDAPNARREHAAFWTGDSMIIWGGNSANALSPVQPSIFTSPGL